MIEQISVSALSPFLDPVGWQGFAYGLLGWKTLKRINSFIDDIGGGNNGNE